jgi:hypothetical protein
VVGLVDDEQPEAIADDRHVMTRAREGRDGHRRQPSLPIPEHADRTVVDERQRALPLRKQGARRHEAQRGGADLRDRGERDARLAGAGGQHDDPTTTAQAPRSERGVLIRPQLDRPERGRWRQSRTRLVRDRDARARELSRERVGEPRGRSERAHTRIPQNARQLAASEVGGQLVEQDGSAIEQESHASACCVSRANRSRRFNLPTSAACGVWKVWASAIPKRGSWD